MDNNNEQFDKEITVIPNKLLIFLGEEYNKIELFETASNTFTFYSPSNHKLLTIQREENQILILYSVNLYYYDINKLNSFKKIKEYSKKKYNNKIKFVLIATFVSSDRYLCDNQEKLLFLDDRMFLFDNYECLFQYRYDDNYDKLVIIDQKGEVQLIEYFDYLDEKKIINFFELLLNEKRIWNLFNQVEINSLVKEIKKFNQSKVKKLIFSYYTVQYKTTDKYCLLIEIRKNQESAKNDIEELNHFLQKYCNLGVSVKYCFPEKAYPIELIQTKQCYRCKKIIDQLTEYSYLCIKCKNKQYCNQCINFFNSFKKFGSQLTILKEIEDYNEYINNNIIDDLPCESYHLLMFIPPDTNKKKDETTIIKYNDLSVCLSYFSPNRSRQLCDVCGLLSPDLIQEQVEIRNDNYELSIDNSLYSYYCTLERHQLNHIKRTSGNYSPLFYCVDCKKYFDWECFLQFNNYVNIGEFYSKETLRYNFLKPTFQGEVIDSRYRWDMEFHNILSLKEGYTDEKIKKIKTIQKEKRIEIDGKAHDRTHRYLIIQAKGIFIKTNKMDIKQLKRNIH